MDAVETHYASPDLTDRIRAGLKALGKRPQAILPRDLAAVDQLHTGGALSTISLIKTWQEKTAPPKVPAILDAGCGNGGSSRLLADQFNCRVTGIDLSWDFIQTARTLTRWCRLDPKVSFEQGSILDLPFEEGGFDAALCQHILLNIPDKASALAQLYRVIKPGGSLILHEITRGKGPDPLMPVPWASDDTTSFLVPWQVLEKMIICAGFTPVHVSDQTQAAADWWQKINTRKKPLSPPALHPGLVFGKTARHFGPNMEKNFSSRAICCIAALFTRS
jgi:SAM-dependent methyltransferase